MNGVSKKLCIAVVGIAAIVSLADGAPNKLPYAISIAVICIVYKAVQGYIDCKNRKVDTNIEEKEK